MTLDEAFSYCEKIATTHYENFPVASFFLSKEKRQYIQVIYAFARTADDIADENNFDKEKRIEELENWQKKLNLCYENKYVDNPIFIALNETIQKTNLPKNFLDDLLFAFMMEQEKNRFQNFDELLFYCSKSANPIGRIVLWIFNYRDENIFFFSDKICSALQLTNFWQDVSIDLKKNRIYIPQTDLTKFNYSEENLLNKICDENFIQLLKFQIESTKSLFYEGSKLLNLVDKDLRIELRLIYFGGMQILRKIEKMNFNTLNFRPHLNVFDKINIFLKGMFSKNFYQNFNSPYRWD